MRQIQTSRDDYEINSDSEIQKSCILQSLETIVISYHFSASTTPNLTESKVSQLNQFTKLEYSGPSLNQSIYLANTIGLIVSPMPLCHITQKVPTKSSPKSQNTFDQKYIQKQ